MSNRLKLASVVSVLMMASFVLFGTDAARMPDPTGETGASAEASAPLLPDPARLLPGTR